MASPEGAEFRLTVLSPGGRDLEQYFDSSTTFSETAPPPVNVRGFAACTRGVFHRNVKSAIAEKTPIILLLRGNFKTSLRALIECKKQGRMVVVAFKESGLDQIAQQLSNPRRLSRFLECADRADGCLAATPEAADIFRQARSKSDSARVAFIPTPYPLEDRQWDLSIPPDKRSGIFIGTREWNVPSRNHCAALLVAREVSLITGESVTVFNLDGGKGGKMLAALNFPARKLRILKSRLRYPDYLREVAKHKIVLQLDRSRVPGQVAGDALLCRTICVGGEGTIERIAFPKSCGAGRSIEQISAIARELLINADARGTAFMESQWRSMERLSFEAGRKQLAAFFLRFK